MERPTESMAGLGAGRAGAAVLLLLVAPRGLTANRAGGGQPGWLSLRARRVGPIDAVSRSPTGRRPSARSVPGAIRPMKNPEVPEDEVTTRSAAKSYVPSANLGGRHGSQCQLVVSLARLPSCSRRSTRIAVAAGCVDGLLVRATLRAGAEHRHGRFSGIASCSPGSSLPERFRRRCSPPARSRWSAPPCSTPPTASTASMSRTSASFDVAPGASRDAAVAQAAHDALVGVMPSQTAAFDAALATALAGIPAQAAADGAAVGAAAARAHRSRGAPAMAGTVRSRRSSCRAFRATGSRRRRPTLRRRSPTTRTSPPFVMPDRNRFTIEGPPPLTSERYATDLNQVKSWGSVNSTVRIGRADTDLQPVGRRRHLDDSQPACGTTCSATWRGAAA